MSAHKTAASLIVSYFLTATAIAVDSAWFKVRGGSWQPDPAVTSRMQNDLQPAVARLAGAEFSTFRQWREYKFQFQGQGADADRFVFVSALCDDHDALDLMERFMVVFDGGSCYFQVKYDPKRQRFYDLIINGVG